MPQITTWDWRLYFPSEGRRAEDFFTLKTRELGYQKPVRLHLDHRSRYYSIIENNNQIISLNALTVKERPPTSVYFSIYIIVILLDDGRNMLQTIDDWLHSVPSGLFALIIKTYRYYVEVNMIQYWHFNIVDEEGGHRNTGHCSGRNAVRPAPSHSHLIV